MDAFSFFINCGCFWLSRLVPRLTASDAVIRTKNSPPETFYGFAAVLTVHEEIISTFGRIQKMLRFFGAFFIISWRTMNCPQGMNWLTPWIALRCMNCLRHWKNRAIQFMKSQISNHEAVGFNSWRLAVNSLSSAVLLTFWKFYDIIILGSDLLDKLEFDRGGYLYEMFLCISFPTYAHWACKL